MNKLQLLTHEPETLPNLVHRVFEESQTEILEEAVSDPKHLFPFCILEPEARGHLTVEARKLEHH